MLRNAPPPAEPTGELDRAERAFHWIKANQRPMIVLGAVVAVVVIGFLFTTTARQRREAFAARELGQARLAVETGNLALAANDLSRLINSYGGTAGSEEATLLLAEVRLLQDQPALAIADLQQFVADGPRDEYRAQAYGLLGAGLEESGQFAAAGEAYLAGADGPGFELVRAELLIDAGRAFTLARDTARATAAYERVLDDFDDAPRAAEARLRLAELRRFDIAG